jgi:hypothetical protein
MEAYLNMSDCGRWFQVPCCILTNIYTLYKIYFSGYEKKKNYMSEERVTYERERECTGAYRDWIGKDREKKPLGIDDRILLKWI